jgi:hypothetical protein
MNGRFGTTSTVAPEFGKELLPAAVKRSNKRRADRKDGLGVRGFGFPCMAGTSHFFSGRHS